MLDPPQPENGESEVKVAAIIYFNSEQNVACRLDATDNEWNFFLSEHPQVRVIAKREVDFNFDLVF